MILLITIIIIFLLKQCYHSNYKLTKIKYQFYKGSVNISFQRYLFHTKTVYGRNIFFMRNVYYRPY